MMMVLLILSNLVLAYNIAMLVEQSKTLEEMIFEELDDRETHKR